MKDRDEAEFWNALAPIEKAITERKEELTKLQPTLTRLQQLKYEIATLEHAKTVLDGGTLPPVMPRPGRSNGVSVAKAALIVLGKNGQSLHVNEIVEQMKIMGNDFSYATVTTALARLLKAGKVVRPEPGVYGMKKADGRVANG